MLCMKSLTALAVLASTVTPDMIAVQSQTLSNAVNTTECMVEFSNAEFAQVLTTPTLPACCTNQTLTCSSGNAVCQVLDPGRSESPWAGSQCAFPQCYDVQTYVCITPPSSPAQFLCPTSAPLACGRSCYSPYSYSCQVNTQNWELSQLVQGTSNPEFLIDLTLLPNDRNILYITAVFVFVMVVLSRIVIAAGVRVYIQYPVYFLVKLRGWINGVPVCCVDTPQLAKKVLIASRCKGSFIEKHISLKAWSPVRSLESIDGMEYVELHKKFRQFMSRLEPVQLLEEIAAVKCGELRQRLTVMDCTILSKLIVDIMITYLTRHSSSELCDTMVAAVEEWRMEIALKGAGNQHRKLESIEILAAHMQVQPDEIDHIIQPFIISPVINITDILASLSYSNTETAADMVHRTIMQNHPFPFLERYLETDVEHLKAGTQVYIPLCEITKKYPNEYWMMFSVGPRKCPGQQIGTILMETIVSKLADSVLFQPELNHHHSGRNNDHTNTWRGFKHFITTVGVALFAPL